MKEDFKISYTAEKWKPLKLQEPCSENYCHIMLYHEDLIFWCYWERKRIGKKVLMTKMEFVIGTS